MNKSGTEDFTKMGFRKKGTEEQNPPKKSKPGKPVQALLILFGFVSLCLGIIGIFLPIVPTTPLILLSAACFLRSSDKLYQWITKNKTFGKYIHNYLYFGRVPAKSKPISIVLVWCFISVSAYLAKDSWVRILLLVIACGVTIHLALLKTIESCTHNENTNSDITIEDD